MRLKIITLFTTVLFVLASLPILAQNPALGGKAAIGGKATLGGSSGGASAPVLYGTPQVSTCAGGGGCTQSNTVNVPNGGVTISANTLVIIFASILISGTPTWSTPSGFTLYTSVTDARAEEATYVFYQLYSSGATLPTTITVTSGDAGGANQSVHCLAYQSPSGFDSGGPQTASEQVADTSWAAPTITTANTNDVILWNWAVVGDVSITAPTVSLGTIEATGTRAAFSANAYTATADVTEASTGTYNNTLSFTNSLTYKVAVTLAIHP